MVPTRVPACCDVTTVNGSASGRCLLGKGRLGRLVVRDGCQRLYPHIAKERLEEGGCEEYVANFMRVAVAFQLVYYSSSKQRKPPTICSKCPQWKKPKPSSLRLNC
ncbi:hypothetical protein NDU88_007841 [Pleurodeles waltl]|uniref:Uncharacterized protein n=1 Tax=Pleurodeles waltl TaxID=8319 RepID=A0AAV7NUR9_PLEWA|nr:hypothetical protein NDU88_007841 [Pleurodeles waltl]